MSQPQGGGDRLPIHAQVFHCIANYSNLEERLNTALQQLHQKDDELKRLKNDAEQQLNAAQQQLCQKDSELNEARQQLHVKDIILANWQG